MYTHSFLILALTALASTTPLSKRATGSTSNEFTQGGCRPVMFAFARGSTEIGNMVLTPHPSFPLLSLSNPT